MGWDFQQDKRRDAKRFSSSPSYKNNRQSSYKYSLGYEERQAREQQARDMIEERFLSMPQEEQEKAIRYAYMR
jgi:hypothetical protein